MSADLRKAYATGIVAFVVIGLASFFVMALILGATAPKRAASEGLAGLAPWIKLTCRIVAAALFGILVGEYSGVRSFRTEAAKAFSQAGDERNRETLPPAARPSRASNWLRLIAWALVVGGVILSI